MDYKNIKTFKALVLIAIFLFGTGCTKELKFVRSTMLTPEKVSRVQVGSTTKEQVLSMFGKPESTLKLERERESLFFKDGNLKSLWVLFDKHGIVIDVKSSK